MKTLKTIAIAALLCSYALSCQQATPEPTAAGSAVQPTPPATPDKCANIKNPLEEIQWLKDNINYFKTYRTSCRVIQYTYKNKPIYYVEKTADGCRWFANCDLSIRVSGGNCGVYGGSLEDARLYEDIEKNAVTPVILFEQK